MAKVNILTINPDGTFTQSAIEMDEAAIKAALEYEKSQLPSCD